MRKLLSGLLVLVMLVALLPVTAPCGTGSRTGGRPARFWRTGP
ncbi:MAG: hypothetical protein ACLSHU_02730 [Oscillospiraceae bacterium]